MAQVLIPTHRDFRNVLQSYANVLIGSILCARVNCQRETILAFGCEAIQDGHDLSHVLWRLEINLHAGACIGAVFVYTNNAGHKNIPLLVFLGD